MRKISSGMRRFEPTLNVKLGGFRMNRAAGTGRLRVPLPPALLAFMGIRVGQRLKASIKNVGLILSVRYVASAKKTRS
jgi:hypothetical protein